MILEGKRIAFLGDSITEGYGVADPANRYDNRMRRDCKLAAVYNNGIGGTRLAHQQKASPGARADLCFCGRAYDIPSDADIVVVYGGVNDYLHGDAPFGVPTDSEQSTFCGGVRWLMTFLKERFAGKVVVFMTPAHVNTGAIVDALPSPEPRKLDPVTGISDGRPLAAYVDVILTLGAELGVPVLDLYRTLGIDPNRPKDRERYAPDGLHFNDEGHGVLAERLTAFLQAL